MNRRILLLLVSLILPIVIMAQPPRPTGAPVDPNGCIHIDKVFQLYGDNRFVDGVPERMWGNTRTTVAVVILPDELCYRDVEAAWSHAVRYTARGLDLPDYEAAVSLMMQRHPSWVASVTRGFHVNYRAESADLDTPSAPLPTATP